MLMLSEAANAFGGILLQMAIGLLIEELTFAGLARLVLHSRAAARHPAIKQPGPTHLN